MLDFEKQYSLTQDEKYMQKLFLLRNNEYD